MRESCRYFYFPSYELVFSLFGNPFEADNRHVRSDVAAKIMNVFRMAYTDIPGDNSPNPVETNLKGMR